ncbi:MAG: hypothetical protein KF754_03400 [Planctomycetes bacterium]|nr:hypothetical protein [Planctomycetota bacterium]
MRIAFMIPALSVLLAACGSKGAPNMVQPNQPAAVNAPGNAAPLAGNQTPEPVPAPDPEPAVPQHEAEYISFEGGLKVYPKAGRVELQVVLLGNQTRPLEFMLVSPGGATHESLFATGARGEHLKRCLEMIQLKEAETKRNGRGHLEVPLGDKVKISVRFRHSGKGVITTVPVEDWLWDILRNATPEPGGWVFTGSFEQYNPELNRSLIESDMKGNLIAVWRDSSCVIDNARKNGATPDVYSPNPAADGIPPGQSEVTLIFEAYKE